MRMKGLIASVVAAFFCAAAIVTVPEYISGTSSQASVVSDDDDEPAPTVMAMVSPVHRPRALETLHGNDYVVRRMQYVFSPTWIEVSFSEPLGQMVQLEPEQLQAEPPPPPPAPPIRERSHDRVNRTSNHAPDRRVSVPRVGFQRSVQVVRPAPVRSASAQSNWLSTLRCRLPGMALNHLGGFIPTNWYTGPIVGATTSVMGAAFYASICEGREAGHGEAYAAIIVGALPFPIPYSWASKAAEWMLAGTDLCAPKIVATHYGPTEGIVPRALLQKNYVHLYCGGPALSREERALLKEVGR